MGLLEHLVVEPTGERKALCWSWDNYAEPIAMASLPCCWLEQYRTCLQVATTFHAKGRGEYEAQLRRAREILLDTLYEDVHDAISGIVRAIGAGERTKALDLCDSLRRTLRGEGIE